MAARVFGFDAAHRRGNDGLADLTYSCTTSFDFGVRVACEVAVAVSTPGVRDFGVGSRPGPFWMWPFLLVVFPGCPQCGGCFVPLARCTVLVVVGVDSRSVLGGVGHPVRCLISGSNWRRVGGAALWSGAQRVV